MGQPMLPLLCKCDRSLLFLVSETVVHHNFQSSLASSSQLNGRCYEFRCNYLGLGQFFIVAEVFCPNAEEKIAILFRHLNRAFPLAPRLDPHLMANVRLRQLIFIYC